LSAPEVPRPPVTALGGPATIDRPALGTIASLRRMTADDHARLERRFGLSARLRTRAAYRQTLERLLGFYGPLEQRLGPVARSLTGVRYDERRKAPLLTADLAALGLSTDPGPSPTNVRLPGIDSPEAALGVLYVVEGATLGNAVIGGRVRERLGVTTSTGASFFCDGPTVRPQWQAFEAVVETFSNGVPSAPMGTAAIECYSCLEEWLCD
jgi:heme oxygenase